MGPFDSPPDDDGSTPAKLSELFSRTVVSHQTGIDESSTPELNDIQIHDHPMFVGCSATCAADRYSRIEADFEELQAFCFGDRQQVELHLRALMSASPKKLASEKPQRDRFISGSIEIARAHDVRFAFCGFHKASCLAAAVDPQRIYLSVLGRLMAVHDYLEISSVWISVDETKKRQIEPAIDLSRNAWYGSSTHSRSTPPPREMNRLFEFVDSKDCRVVQLADLGAYFARFTSAVKFDGFRRMALRAERKCGEGHSWRMEKTQEFWSRLESNVVLNELEFPADGVISAVGSAPALVDI